MECARQVRPLEDQHLRIREIQEKKKALQISTGGFRQMVEEGDMQGLEMLC
jgi:hypothetical protein